MSIQSLYNSIAGASAAPASIEAQIKLKLSVLQQFAASQFAALAGDAINPAELEQAKSIGEQLDRLTEAQKTDFLTSLNELYSKTEQAVLAKLVAGAGSVAGADIQAIAAAARPEPEPEEPVTEESEFDFSDEGEATEAPAEQTVSVAAASVGPDTNAAAAALAGLLKQLLS